MHDKLISKRVFAIACCVFAACSDDAGTLNQSDDAGQDAKDAGASFCASSSALDLAPCDPKTATFTLKIDNPFYPLVVGQTSIFEGDDEGEKIHLEVEVLDETEVVAGVTARVVEEREQADGEIVEVSRNYFAQSSDGTVCYFGEDVDIYEAGKVTAHDGAWRADSKNHPGIVMPADPMKGDFFAQEDAPKLAEDRAEFSDVGKSIKVPAGKFTDTISSRECSPLEPGIYEPKFYARGVGLIIDDKAELVSY